MTSVSEQSRWASIWESRAEAEPEEDTAVTTTATTTTRSATDATPRPSAYGAKPEHSGPTLPFRAALDVCEFDDRRRPGLSWIASACELSRGHIAFRSRRMCHVHREVLIAVHMVDAEPVPLFGEVAWCEYVGDGLYRTEVALEPLPDAEWLAGWLRDRRQRPGG